MYLERGLISKIRLLTYRIGIRVQLTHGGHMNNVSPEIKGTLSR